MNGVRAQIIRQAGVVDAADQTRPFPTIEHGFALPIGQVVASNGIVQADVLIEGQANDVRRRGAYLARAKASIRP